MGGRGCGTESCPGSRQDKPVERGWQVGSIPAALREGTDASDPSARLRGGRVRPLASAPLPLPRVRAEPAIGRNRVRGRCGCGRPHAPLVSSRQPQLLRREQRPLPQHQETRHVPPNKRSRKGPLPRPMESRSNDGHIAFVLVSCPSLTRARPCRVAGSDGAGGLRTRYDSVRPHAVGSVTMWLAATVGQRRYFRRS